MTLGLGARVWMLLLWEEATLMQLWALGLWPFLHCMISCFPLSRGAWGGSSENPLWFQKEDLLILENITFYSDLPFPANATWIWTLKIYGGFLDQYEPPQKHIVYAVTKKKKKKKWGERETKVRYFSYIARNNYALRVNFPTRWSSSLKFQKEITKYATAD